MTSTPWKCPVCGYDNVTALCNLCGGLRPRAEPPAAPEEAAAGTVFEAAGGAEPPRASGAGGALAGLDRWTQVEFAALLPVSLVVCLLPGGLRHPRARLALHVVGVAVLAALVLCIPLLVSLYARFAASAQDAFGG